ncbi:OCH1 [Candida oxycetoniae]|uniref:OCH1 n=1 Tax=Candida oxycetoniae TaxID=497107 RepID=A0AAI9SZR1_9ASCO|nr:OCH1 [Candida oxycetoniae]KAI3406208.2 OCH1 [Candida oxycetoniae]
MSKQKYRSVLIGVVTIVACLFLFFEVKGNHAYKTDYSLPKFQLLQELELNKNWKTRGLYFQPKFKSSLEYTSQIENQLATHFPYEQEAPFPKFIWQTWKVALDDKTFPRRYERYQATWDDTNPDYKHFVIPDEQCDLLVEELYASVPDVAHAYKLLPKSIMKADFFRYLILFARGGVYTDIDTVGLKPIDTWISNSKEILGKPNQAGLVVGIEADPDRPDWNSWYARRIQFCQWTIQSKRGHPMLLGLIAKIAEITLTRSEKGQLHKTLGKDSGGDIMDWTGPGIFTDYVFNYMNSIMQSPQQSTKKTFETIIDWKLFTGMVQPIAIDDVLILPITSFSPDVNQMGAKDSKDPMAYAKHMFSGSWKDDQIKD